MAGLTMLLMTGGANSARKILQQMAIGTPRMTAPNVTATEPIIIGKMPYKPRLGAHTIPKTKLKTPTLTMIGTPSINMKIVIRAKTDRAERAIRRKIRLVSFSICPLTFLT
jgi:hypothetical protein